MSEPASEPRLKLKLQLQIDGDFAIGPGKAMVLEAIAAHGSISAAGRAIGMSYRRTWLLVDAMNRAWEAPLVTAAVGGRQGGGAQLSALGQEVLATYRAFERRVMKAAHAAPELAALTARLHKGP